MGWVWKRAKLVAKDNDPQRVERLARIRFHAERLQAHEVMVFADELDIHLLPKVGAAWMPKGSQEEVMTPGQNAKHYLAGALNLATGKILHCLGPRKTNALFRDLLTLLDRTYAEQGVRRIYVVVDNYKIHKAKAVNQCWQRTRALSCCGYRRIVPVPTRLSGPLAMSMINARGTTNGSACAI